MNNRTRQWIKAGEMIDRIDPQITCIYDMENTAAKGILIIRRSQLEEVRKEYGDTLHIWFDNEI